MRNLKRLNLLKEISNYLNGSTPEINPLSLENSHLQFEKIITRTVNRTTCPIETLRCLNKYKAYLTGYNKCLMEKPGPTALNFCSQLDSLIMVLDSEIEIVHLKIKHPHLTSSCNDRDQPVIYLEGVTQSEIVEMVTSIYLLKGGLKPDKSRADFKYFVERLGSFFGVKVNNAEQIKHTILNRKVNVTSFLDRLRSALIEASMK